MPAAETSTQTAAPVANVPAERNAEGLPRWRAGRDFITQCYCLGRRRAYIKSARLFSSKASLQYALKELGRLTAGEMFDTLGLLGKGEGLKDAMANPKVPARVKAAMRSLMLCMSNVIGSNAHRTTLRHICSSYRNLFGPPLEFMTPNVADNQLLMMSLVYENAEVGRWRLLEEDTPAMPGREEMLRRVAADPVGQAIVTDLMIELFLEHILGVAPRGGKGFADGVASSCRNGVFGPVQGYFGPIETQGRGGLHAHISVFVLDPIRAQILDRLRNHDVDDALKEQLKLWRLAVLDKVGSMQFDSVEEIGRQLDVQAVPPLPFSADAQRQCYMDGRVEEEDVAVKQAPTGSDLRQAWASDDPCGPARQRPFVAATPAVQRGGQLSRNPRYRRMPPYRSAGAAAGGEAIVCSGMESQEAEAKLYASALMDDAWMCYAKSHLHSCRKTCWKHAGGAVEGDEVRVCRFNFFHVPELAYSPRRWPGKIKCRNPACHYQKGPDGKPIELVDEHHGGRSVRVHPEHCPADVPVGSIRKRLRRGKALVLPHVLRRDEETCEPLEHDFRPQPCLEDSYGRAGRAQVLRYHPLCGSSNPVCQVCMRCNFDVQCTDRVFVLLRKQVYAADLSGGAGGVSGDQQAAEDASDAEPQEVCPDCAQHLLPTMQALRLQGGGGFDEDAGQEEDDDGQVDHFPAFGEGEPDVDLDEGPDGPPEEFLGEYELAPGATAADERAPAAVDSDRRAALQEVQQTVKDVVVEYLLAPGSLEEEEFSAEMFEEALTIALLKRFRDSTNQGHYQTDYSTKANPELGSVLHEMAIGIDRLRQDEAVREALNATGSSRLQDLLDAGRRTLIRLETAGNRASLKKLSEMCFQMLFRHECYMSHQTWTVFCKGIVWLAFRASRRRQLAFLGDGAVPESTRLEPGWARMDDEEGGQQEQDEEERGVMRARVVEEQPVLDEGDRAGVTFATVATQSQRLDWLHRGQREPLRSMGLYQYSMFVYTTYQDAAAFDALDFVTYRFADTHPGCAKRVQKLRLDQMFRIPRLFGFTMPTREADPERNCLFKSVLFRPLAAPTEPCPDEVVPYLSAVDERGSFVAPWDAWYVEQRKLAKKYAELQATAGKLFVMEDVDMTIPYMAELEAERDRPSAAEFMANLTVEVCTDMDLAAESRSGVRGRSRPEASEFDIPPKPERSRFGTAEEEAGAACGPHAEAEPHEGMQREELGKRTEAMYPIPHEDLLTVVFSKDMNCAATAKKYKDSFMDSMGASSAAALQEEGRRADDAAKSDRARGAASWFHESVNLTSTFEACLSKQEQLFEHRRTAGNRGPEAEAPREPAGMQTGEQDPATAHLADRPDDIRRYAQELARELACRPEKPVVLNEEQWDFLAVVVDKLEDLKYGHRAGDDPEDSTCKADKVEAPPCRILLHGPGGTGKTEVVAILQALMLRFFGADSCVAVASSNSAARVIGGDTVHSSLRLSGQSSMRLGKLCEHVTDDLKDFWTPVEALIVEEVSLMSPDLLGALSFRTSLARQAKHNCDPNLYQHPEHMFGKIPIVVYLGDFMQLAPISGKQRTSLLKPAGMYASDEHRGGQRVFWEGLTHVLMLRKTHRFVDLEQKPPEPCKVLPRLLAYMRDPDGQPMPNDLWKEVQQWAAKGSKDPRHHERRIRNGFEMAIGWEAVARLMQYRAARDAKAAGRKLLYVQAIDVSKGEVLSPQEYRRALQVVNASYTGRLMGMCPLFVGMRVRLCAKLSAKHGIVHDAAGEVVGFVFDAREQLEDAAPDRTTCGYSRLKYMPRGVLVKFDECAEDVGYGPGIFVVRPVSSSWQYKTHTLRQGRRVQQETSISRTQIPLMPERVRTCQTSQGLSMDAATMFLQKMSNMSVDDWWLHVYVMISRVRTSKQILVHGLPPRSLLEQGPPQFLHAGLGKLEASYEQHAGLADAARRRLAWQPRKEPIVTATAVSRSRGAAAPSGADVPSSAGDAPRPTPSGAGLHARPPVGVGNASRPGVDTAGEAQSATQGKDEGKGIGKGTGKSKGKGKGKGKLALAQEPPRRQGPPGQPDGKSASSPASAEAGDGDVGAAVAATTPPPKRSFEEARRGDGDSRGMQAPAAVSLKPAAASAAARQRMQTGYSSATAQAKNVVCGSLARLRASVLDRGDLVYLVPEAELQIAGVVIQGGHRPGFHNQGNSCFVNAALQVLLRIDIVRRLLHGHRECNTCEQPQSCLVCALAADAAAMCADVGFSGACFTTQHARAGRYGQDFRRRADGAPQCDAVSFLTHVLDAIAESERRAIAGLDATPLGEEESRTAARDVVWGSLFRHRLRCPDCSRVSDELAVLSIIALMLLGNTMNTLEQLWARHCSEHDADEQARCPDLCEQWRGTVKRQWFLEREPPVMFFQLERGKEEHTVRNGRVYVKKEKIQRMVSFPQRLEVLRSGPYMFAGAVRHIGQSLSHGHYVASVWLGGDRYAELNDEGCQMLTWAQVTSKEALQQVYLLAYVRVGFWNGNEDNGTRQTPYTRDAASESLFVVADTEAGVANAGLVAPSSNQASAKPGGAVGKRARPPGTPGQGARGSSSSGQPPAVIASPDGKSPPAKKFKCRLCHATSAAMPVGDSSPAAVRSPPLKCARCGGDALEDGDEDLAWTAMLESPLPAFPLPRVPRSGEAAGVGSTDTESNSQAGMTGAAAWKRFTPLAVQQVCCLARTWDEGKGGQCDEVCFKKEQICRRHCKSGCRYGLVTGPIPAEELQEFQRAEAEQKATNVLAHLKETISDAAPQQDVGMTATSGLRQSARLRARQQAR